jgi:hypothetical protein
VSQSKLVRRKFVLLNEMVPVHFVRRDVAGSSFRSHSVGFVCPLPVGYKRVLQEKVEDLHVETMNMIGEVESLMHMGQGSFVNLFPEYKRKDEELEKLRRGFSFSHVLFSRERGLSGITAGNDVNSGDIYLAEQTSCSCYYEFITLDGFKDLFEPRTAWYCHNVDYYWQALMDREVAVRYFNILYRFLLKLEGDS